VDHHLNYAGVSIEFTHGELLLEYGCTSITFGPDGILYAGTLHGDLLKITLDDEYNILSFVKSNIVIQAQHGSMFSGRNIMGILQLIQWISVHIPKCMYHIVIYFMVPVNIHRVVVSMVK
jgi:hypothetical protein